MSVWNNYVADVINGNIKEGDSVFEAGCGVLAFLTPIYQMNNSNIRMGGVDGASKLIELVKNDVLPKLMANSPLNNQDGPESIKENFSVGLVPDCLYQVPDNHWNAVVCNSVF